MIYELLNPYIQNTRKIELKRGQIVYNEGDCPESIYFVISGIVGLFHISESGKETFLRVFGKGSVFGHRSFLADTCYHATSIVLSPCTLQVISKEDYDKILSQHPHVLREITKIIAKDLGEAELRLAGLQDKPVMTRVIQALVFLKLKYPDQTWTRKEIAEFSGSTFETVTRVMTKLADIGLIIKNGRDFTIANNDRLIEFSTEETLN